MNNRKSDDTSGGELVQFASDGKELPAALVEALHRQGIAPSMVNVPDVVHYAKTTWEDLCSLGTRDRKTMVSPLCVVSLVSADPDAKQEFEGYKGVVRFEFATELGGTYFMTHAMTYADTGENLPLWAWMRVQNTPFLARFGYIETRNTERHVVRPMPRDIEIV